MAISSRTTCAKQRRCRCDIASACLLCLLHHVPRIEYRVQRAERVLESELTNLLQRLFRTGLERGALELATCRPLQLGATSELNCLPLAVPKAGEYGAGFGDGRHVVRQPGTSRGCSRSSQLHVLHQLCHRSADLDQRTASRQFTRMAPS